MGSNFDKIKRAVRLRTWIASLVFGLCCACLITGALLLALKLSFVQIAWYYYAAIGGGVFLVSGGIFFAVTRLNDRQLAVKLDGVYMLGERVQTMVEFQAENQPIYVVQREDADRRLGELKRKKPTIFQTIIAFFALIVCIGSLVAGLVVPQKTHPLPPDEGELPFDMKAEQIADLRKMIENVQTDVELDNVDGVQIAEGYVTAKTSYVNSLNSLLATVQGEITNNQMKDAVTATMVSVIDGTSDKTSFTAIYEAFDASDASRFMADALLRGAKAYSTTESVSYAFVKGQAGTVLDAAVYAELEKGTKVISDAAAEATDTVMLKLVLQTFYLGLDTQLQTLTADKISQTDELLTSFAPLCRDLKTLGSVPDSTKPLAINDSLNKTALSNFLASASKILYKQSYLCLMRDYICQGLSGIFGVPIPEIFDVEEEGDQPSGGGDENGSGAGGDGSTEWPGNDVLFDPNSTEFKHYGELLRGGRYAQIIEVLANSDLPEEVKSCITKYLDAIMSKQE